MLRGVLVVVKLLKHRSLKYAFTNRATWLKGKHSNFEFEAKLYKENVSKLKYNFIVCHIRETFKFRK